MPATRSIILDIEERKRGNALLGAANDMDKLAAETDRTANKFKQFTEDTKRVNAEIDRSTAKVKDLRQQIARTGDFSLFGDLRKEEARLRNLRNLVTGLRKDFDAGAVTVTNDFGKQLTSAFSDLPTEPLAIGAVVGVVAAAAPLIGAMVAGATVGLVGTGGLIGGILAASHDQRVKDAFGGLLQSVKDEFFGAGSAFVEPIIKSTAILDKAFRDLSLGPLFSEIAPQLTVIVKGFADLIENSLPGLNNFFARSGAFANVAGKGLAYLGESLGFFLDEISSSPGALEGLQAFFGFLGGTIKALGGVLKFLSDAFHQTIITMGNAAIVASGFFDAVGAHGKAEQIRQSGQQLLNFAHAAEEAMPATVHLGDVTNAMGRAFTQAEIATMKSAEALQRENDELQNTEDQIDKVINQILGLDNAQLALSKDMKDLGDAVAQNGKHWNDNTDAAYANRQAILAALADLERVREEEIKNGMAVGDANAAYEDGLQKILNYAGALGATKAQLDAIKGRYDVELVLTTFIQGLGATLGNALAGFTFGGKRAAGGPVGAGAAYMVGENGPEMFVPNTPGSIVPNGATGTTVINFSIPPGDGLGAAVVAYLAKHAQVQGGGNLQLAITGRTA